VTAAANDETKRGTEETGAPTGAPGKKTQVLSCPFGTKPLMHTGWLKQRLQWRLSTRGTGWPDESKKLLWHSGRRGRGFKSHQPDHCNKLITREL